MIDKLEKIKSKLKLRNGYRYVSGSVELSKGHSLLSISKKYEEELKEAEDDYSKGS